MYKRRKGLILAIVYAKNVSKDMNKSIKTEEDGQQHSKTFHQKNRK